jgi:hypothetical protein
MALARVCVLLALVAALAPTRAWEYAEHHILGDAAFKTFLDRFPDAKRHLSADGAANNFKLPKLGATVSFGRMVGLWADIYGNPDKPIIAGTDPQAEFESQFDASISGSGSGGVGVGDTKSEWSLVEAAADFELSGVRSRGAAFYESLDNQQSVCNLAFATASPPGTCPKIGGTADYAKNIISAIEKKSRFMALADVNFDHFGFYQTLVRLPAGAVKMPNRVVYVAAHTAACKRIMDATTPEQVDEAVLMEAAALHYLSDMFASGHLRTPRKELYDACETKKAGEWRVARGAWRPCEAGAHTRAQATSSPSACTTRTTTRACLCATRWARCGRVRQRARASAREVEAASLTNPRIRGPRRSLRRRTQRAHVQLGEQGRDHRSHGHVAGPAAALPREGLAASRCAHPAADWRAQGVRRREIWQDHGGGVEERRGAELGEDARRGRRGQLQDDCESQGRRRDAPHLGHRKGQAARDQEPAGVHGDQD